MRPSLARSSLAAALALAALLSEPNAPVQAQTAPPSPAAGAPAPWRPLIVVDPRAVLRAQQHPHRAPARKPMPRPRAHATPASGAEIFERYDTAPSPRPR